MLPRYLCLSVLYLLLCQCNNEQKSQDTAQEQSIRELVDDEELLLEITLLTKQLARAIESQSIINSETQALFCKQIECTDLELKQGSASQLSALHQVSSLQWLPSEPSTITTNGSPLPPLWQSLFEHMDVISSVSLGFVSGQTTSKGEFHSRLLFKAAGCNQAQQPASLKGHLELHWIQQDEQWKIRAWHSDKIKLYSSPNQFFSNQTQKLITGTAYQRATRSPHEEKISQYIQRGETRLPKGAYSSFFKLESDYQHPSVAVVDVNQDGWDDLFVTSLWEPCQLWINLNGTGFKEEASRYGLDLRACCTSAIFADFDNDGDPDLFLGRSLEPSKLFWNEDGHFSPDSNNFPYLVTSVSAADCNNDGLLDIYLSTYGPAGTEAQSNPKWVQDFLPVESHAGYFKAQSQQHRYFNLAGPKNFLLINRGSRQFAAASATPELDQFHNTYQASWADYDKDGDADLYICNDFAPDALLRNDGNNAQGEPQFSDVSVALSGDTMKGFGMGASWGDFDNDQQLDLFVSNMYSKAGKRVLSRFEGVDPRLHFSARGNLLFKQSANKFHQLAGNDDNFPVHQGGWAFGGQFADFDNDGWLDIYVPNGFYTAPKKVESQVDL